MSKFANLQGLKNFQRKVNNAKISQNLIDKIVGRILKEGIGYARSLYNGSKNISLYYTIENDVYRFYAEGDAIAYLEFGTGERGNGSYEGNLPENQLTFYSNKFGREVVLDYGWTYSYANKIDENQPIWSGFESQAQMWKTAQYLRARIPLIVREVFESESIS